MSIHLIEDFADTCLRFPRKTAVVDGPREASFAELASAAWALSRAVSAVSPRQNRPVVVFLDKSIEAVAAQFGTLMSGKCYCPIDVKSPPERLRRMLRTLEADVAVTAGPLKQKLVEAGLPAEAIVEVESCLPSAAPAPWSEVLEGVRSMIDTDPAYVIFTSGSTGEPKGVTISHRGVADYILWARECYQVDETEVIANQAPFFFDNSTLDLFLMASAGATLHLVPELCYRFPVQLVEYLRKKRITFLFWVPSVLVSVANLDLLEGVELPDLEKILFAGEVMPVKQLDYWRRHVPHALFSNLYGPTEITVDCTYFHVPQGFSGSVLPIGRPCRNSDVLILNEQNRPATRGEVGELCVRGTSLALGYWNNPEKTREVFCQNPLHTHYNDPIYRTGDLAYEDEDGVIFFVGRKDNQIKHRGYRIELGEIETAAQEVEGVGACCAVYEGEQIHLFLELCRGNLATIQGTLAQRLPRYMLPTRYHVVEKMPTTPNGKTDRMALTDLIRREHGTHGDAWTDFAGYQARN